MRNLYPNLFSPVRVAGHLLKNRIISAPSTIHTASSGQPYPTERGIRFFEARAKAGAGLVTCAGVSVGGAHNDGVHCSWDINVPNHTNRLCDLAQRIHLYGAKCTMELIGVFPGGYTVSDGCSIMGSPPIGREIPIEVMMQFKQDYTDAAAAIKKSGFDGIMLHFGHSIPIAQFLSPLTNKRADQYGGSTENRCRYPKEIIDSIREAVGRDMIIDLRLSGTEFEPGGIQPEEGIRIAEILQENVDIIQVSAGMHNARWMTWTHPGGFLPPMPNVYLAEAVKKSGRVGKFISAIGGIGSLRDAEEILASGKADFVAMARSLIADIDLISKSLAGNADDVTPCIKCMRCHDSDNYEQHMQCTVNAMVGLEEAIERVPAPGQSKKVAVIGGGPGGMRAALTAAERGHQVTLFEKTDSLGGALKFADCVPFKYPLKAFKDFLVCQVQKRGIRVELNRKAAPEDVKGFDAVIAAVGAVPLVPPIPGIESALSATGVCEGVWNPGSAVVVIGGGQVGCETGLHLARQGLRVTLLEMRDTLAPDASKTQRDELMNELENEPLFTAVCGAACTGVSGGEVTYTKDSVQESATGDTVILAAGMRPLRDEADAFMGLTPEFAQVGDCVRPRTVEWANKEGFYAAIRL